MLQTRQPLGLEAEPRNRGLPITGSQSPGPNQTNKQTTPKSVGKSAIFATFFHSVSERFFGGKKVLQGYISQLEGLKHHF